MTFAYLGVLLAGLACMVLLDLRFHLVIRAAGGRAAIVLVIGVAFFLAWDVAGIALGIFHRAENTVSTGILLAPELPLEELVFLVFLCYLTLVLWSGTMRLIAAKEGRR
jgi:lycopene cyclase domain-containing protein